MIGAVVQSWSDVEIERGDKGSDYEGAIERETVECGGLTCVLEEIVPSVALGGVIQSFVITG